MRKLLISVSRTKISFHFKFHVLYKLLKYPYMLVYLIFLRFIFVCLGGRFTERRNNVFHPLVHFQMATTSQLK